MTENILIILLAVFINGWIIYYITYFKKKGEYQVLKEDIEDITEKVESVKTQFTIQTNKIQAEIEFLNQKKLSIKTEERNSILNFVDKYSIWLNEVINFPSNNLTKERTQEILNKIDKSRLEFNVAEARLELFFKTAELDKQTTVLKIKTLEIEGNVATCLLTLNYLHDKAEDYKKRILLGTYNQVEYETILQEQQQTNKGTRQATLAIFQELLTTKSQVVEILRNKLNEILDSTN